MNTVMRLEVAMNKIYKNSFYYQTLYLSLLFAQESLQPVCVLHQRAMALIVDGQLLLQKLIKREKMDSKADLGYHFQKDTHTNSNG